MKNETLERNYKNIIAEKKAMMEVIERLLDELESIERYQICEQIKVGEHQDTDWHGNLMYLDEDGKRTEEVTDIPYMVSDYEYRIPDSIDETTSAKYKAVCTLRDTLAKMI